MRADVKGALRECAMWVTLLPFCLFSLLAPGIMPLRADHGGLTLVICSGHEMVEITVDPHSLEPVDEAADDTGNACPWALSRIAADIPALPDLPRTDLRFKALEPPAAETIRLIARATGLPPATGPPSAV